jgi:type I restriction enzyme S subunit
MGVREQITRMSQGTSGSMVKITGSGVANLPISIPDLSEQDRILSVYATAMTQISEQEREVEKLRLLKRGLVDNLLTGQLRY